MKRVTVEFLIVNNCRTEISVPDYFDIDDPDSDYIINEINHNLDKEKFEMLDEDTIKIRQLFLNEADYYDLNSTNNRRESMKPLTNEEIFDMLYVEELDSECPDYVTNEDSMFIEIE